MNEIGKSDLNITQPMLKNVQPETKSEPKEVAPQTEAKDYKEAAAAPGAEAAGRAMVSMNKANKADAVAKAGSVNKTDNIENDINAIIKNPQLAEDSDKMFDAAEKAGVPYPQAATFATTELTPAK